MALDWRPSPGLNLIWGDNGQGKTNLLEGIHLALTGRSFRTRHDEECLPWNLPEDTADPTLVQAMVAGSHGERRLRTLIGKGWKRAFADERWLARLADLMQANPGLTEVEINPLRAGPDGGLVALDALLVFS